MNDATTHDPDAGFELAYSAPPLACDAHFHVFGPAGKYPYGTDIRYKPPYEPLEAYLRLARRIGFARYVFVQPSAYGFDNSCMLDAMRELDPAVRRGIIDLDESKTGDKELAELHALGVRGIRVNVSPVRKPEAGLADSMKPRIARLAKLSQEIGWHLDFLGAGLAGQRANAGSARIADRIHGRAYGAVSLPRTALRSVASRNFSSL